MSQAPAIIWTHIRSRYGQLLEVEHLSVMQESHGNGRLVKKRLKNVRRAIPFFWKATCQDVENDFHQP
ncbi:hypothetical protein JDV02_008032 [Purpureocillium takamizusanense]|uniref:Uncharacterized protein n=1 Tax=Purpureocillium takamizusanense TaxID=2060973 RepID=A0A9Q8QNQ5_9HYPO|nr:uncharacterized protein JDV02_008032 [Purpureocillium takamizusanense]UNI22111.1 hypothetical protein JDV02_008032 [Purpureocillium takamizusanense]